MSHRFVTSNFKPNMNLDRLDLLMFIHPPLPLPLSHRDQAERMPLASFHFPLMFPVIIDFALHVNVDPLARKAPQTPFLTLPHQLCSVYNIWPCQKVSLCVCASDGACGRDIGTIYESRHDKRF